MTQKLTNTFMDRCKPGERARWVTDSKISGFTARIHPSGKITYCLWYERNGRRIRHRIGDGMSADVAREIAVKLKGEIGKGTYPDEKIKAEYTIGDMLERYLKNHLGAGHQAKRFIDPLIADLGDELPEYFTPKEATVFFDELEAGSATKTIMIKYLSAAWNYGFARGHVSVPNPCREVRKIIKHVQQKRAKAIEPEQYQQLFAVLREMSKEGTWNQFALLVEEFLLFAPLRKSEALQAKECDLDGNKLRIPRHKASKKHDQPLKVVLSDESLEVLQKAIALKKKLGLQDNPYIFASMDGRYISTQTLFRVFSELRRRVGIDLVQHNTRSGVINVLIEEGHTAEEISMLTGQSAGVIQTYYVGVLKNKAKDLASKSGSIIGSYAKPRTMQRFLQPSGSIAKARKSIEIRS